MLNKKVTGMLIFVTGNNIWVCLIIPYHQNFIKTIYSVFTCECIKQDSNKQLLVAQAWTLCLSRVICLLLIKRDLTGSMNGPDTPATDYRCPTPNHNHASFKLPFRSMLPSVPGSNRRIHLRARYCAGLVL